MAAQPSPVTPTVVRWAIEEDGRPIEVLAAALKVDVDTLDGWRSGDTAPTRGQVSNLAEVLQRPRAMFFLPRPPSAATLPASFRHPPGDGRTVSAAVRRKVREARRVQHAVAWALRDGPMSDVPRSVGDVSPETAAATVREWLAVTDDEQRSWKDDRAGLRAWRTALDARGVLVFVLEIGRDEVRGFSAWDDYAPLIVANVSGVSPAARSFTVAHELGHLLRRGDATCVEPPDDEAVGVDVEQWCERFGAALLMPRPAMQVFAGGRAITGGGADLGDVRAAMRQFRVSGRAAALRLVDMGYATPALYRDVARAFVPAPPVSDASVVRASRAVSRIRGYGPRAVRTVLTALTPRDAMSVLRVTIEDVRRMADEVPDAPVF